MSFPKISNHWTTVLCLMSPLWGAARLFAQCVQGEQQASIITFQVPGSDITAPFAINNSSAIAGNYSTPTSATLRGFVRAANGAIATFSVPGSFDTSASSINDGGAIAGTFDTSTGLTLGYVRSALGQITTFNAPVSAQNSVFSAYINAAGTIAGSYGTAYNQPVHGFVRAASGAMTTFAVSGSVSTSPVGINAEGLIVGSWTDSSQATHGFFRLPSGQMVTFDAPGSESTTPVSVNSGGTISGWVLDKYGNVHQFVRSNRGSFSFFNVPAGNGTAGAVINAVGLLAVEYSEGEVAHGLVVTPDGTQTSFDAPGSNSTYVAAMNDFGVITGLSYQGSAGLTYVRFPTCTDKFQTGAYEVSDSGSLYLDGEFYLHGDPSVRLSPQTAGNASQHWQFSGVTGGFRITNLGTGQYVSDQSGVLQQGQVEDLWTLTPVPWGWSIRNNRTGRLLADPAVSGSALSLNGNGSAWQMSAPK